MRARESHAHDHDYENEDESDSIHGAYHTCLTRKERPKGLIHTTRDDSQSR